MSYKIPRRKLHYYKCLIEYLSETDTGKYIKHERIIHLHSHNVKEVKSNIIDGYGIKPLSISRIW